MSLLLRAESPTFTLPGICFTTLSSPSRGARENSVWEVSVEPGVVGSPHRVTREETFVALQGTAVIALDGQPCELTAGNALVVQPGQMLALSNTGTQAFHAIAILPVGGQALVGDQPPFTPPWAA